MEERITWHKLPPIDLASHGASSVLHVSIYIFFGLLMCSGNADACSFCFIHPVLSEALMVPACTRS